MKKSSQKVVSKKKQENKIVQTKETKPKQIKGPIHIQIWIVILIFLGTTIIFFWDQILSHAFFWDDITQLWYPFQTFAAREFASGKIPFWNPYIFSGMPFIADIEAGFFYPLNRILSIFVDSNGHLPIAAVQIVIILHFFIAQVSMYSLMRYFKASSIASIISSISFSFSLIMVCHVFHPMMLFHFTWFPTVLLFFIRGLEERKLIFAIYSGWFLGFSILAGHPQSTLFEFMFLGFALVWYLVNGLIRKVLVSKELLYFAICALLPFIIGAGIYSIQLLPARELASMAQRQDISFEKASEGSLYFKQIYTSVVPKIFGSVDGESMDGRTLKYALKGEQYYIFWETAFYFGIVALLLGLLGAIDRARSLLGGILLTFIGFSFLYSLGKHFFIFEIFFGLPFFEYFRMPARMMYYFVLAFSVFAGFGFDYLWSEIKSKNLLKNLVIINIIPVLIAILTASGLMGSMFDIPQPMQNDIQNYGLIALILIAAVNFLALLVNRGLLNATIGGLILAAIVFIDLYNTGVSFNRGTENPEKAYEINPETKKVFEVKPPKELFRVSIRLYKEGVIAMTRNQGMIDKIMTTDGYNPLVLKRGTAPSPDLRISHDLNNVKYAVLKDSLGRGFKFFEYHPYSQRAYLVHKALTLDSEKVFDAMKNNVYDYKNLVILEENPIRPLSGNPQDTLSDKVECLVYNNNDFKYKTSSKENGIVFFSEIWYPAWKAYLDGQLVKVYRANYCYRAVEVPAGEHEIEMRFESSKYKAGMYMTLFTIISSFVVWLFTMILDKKK